MNKELTLYRIFALLCVVAYLTSCSTPQPQKPVTSKPTTIDPNGYGEFPEDKPWEDYFLTD